MSEQSLDDVLNGVEPEQAQEGAPEVEKTEAKEAETQEVESKEESKDEPKEEPAKSEPPTDEPKEESWTKAMALDERRKRQAAEEELRKYKADKVEPEKTARPDVFEDQAAYTESITSEIDAKLAAQKVELSRQFMLDSKPDYEEKETLFLEMAKDNPALRTELKKASNPAKFVYDQALKYEEYKKVQDVDAYKASLRADLEKEIRAELEEKKEGPKIVPSLASKPSSTEKQEPEDDSLESLYG